MSTPRLASVEALASAAGLETILGPVAAIETSALRTPGFSGSTHRRLTVRLRSGATRRLVLKHTVLAADWTLVRSGDRVGREGCLLAEQALAPVWEAFASPYLAWAATGGELGLLMEDLSDHLLPDVREPVTEAQEERIVAALAALHARFWESPALALPWLTPPRRLFELVGPQAAAEEVAGGTPPPVHARAHQGWTIAFRRLPPGVAALLREPSAALAGRSAHLPRTVVHGDVKVANFALLPDGRVSAFDWAFVGAGSVALELGWYLAVNATRLASSKEDTLARYRRQLEARLGRALAHEVWSDIEAQAVLGGAAMLLWSKALALEAGAPGALEEWNWWVERLERT